MLIRLEKNNNQAWKENLQSYKHLLAHRHNNRCSEGKRKKLRKLKRMLRTRKRVKKNSQKIKVRSR